LIVHLGLLYFYGVIPSSLNSEMTHPGSDDEKALYWFEQAVNQSYAPAVHNIALFHQIKNLENPVINE
jgi:TPR repeat protein